MKTIRILLLAALASLVCAGCVSDKATTKHRPPDYKIDDPFVYPAFPK